MQDEILASEALHLAEKQIQFNKKEEKELVFRIMLNYTPEQLEAINTIDDNLQIIACAGSGRTQVISQRIVNILKAETGIQPRNIVAFTYTEKAAAELKTRVLKLCKEQLPGMKGLVDMYIGTIHSWCQKFCRSMFMNIRSIQSLMILS